MRESCQTLTRMGKARRIARSSSGHTARGRGFSRYIVGAEKRDLMKKIQGAAGKLGLISLPSHWSRPMRRPKTSSPGDRPPRCPDPPTDRSESVTPLVSSPTGSGPPGRRRGGPIRTLAFRTQCNPSTVWRICRRYEDAGLPDLLEPPQRAGQPARISALQRAQIVQLACLEPVTKGLHITHWTSQVWPAKRSKMGSSRPSAIGQSKRSSIRWTSSRIAAVLADVSHRHSLQGACREDPLVLRQRRAVGPAGLLGGLSR